MKRYFCGWYFKCQSASGTVALIAAYHVTDGIMTCSVQVITEEGSYKADFPADAFCHGHDSVVIDRNVFSADGICMELHTPEVCVTGSLSFGPLSPIRYDIMGPFKFVPFMECRHSVFSMKHSVTGVLYVNGFPYTFINADGYMEGDRGFSFPREYIWTQCCFRDGSLMLSVADIPIFGIHFTGVIGVIQYRGREYRLATYLGARAAVIQEGQVVIRQGGRKLTVRRLDDKKFPLAAPVAGSMSRTIHEAASCRAFYRYEEKGRVVFEFASDRASFEYEYKK